MVLAILYISHQVFPVFLNLVVVVFLQFPFAFPSDVSCMIHFNATFEKLLGSLLTVYPNHFNRLCFICYFFDLFSRTVHGWWSCLASKFCRSFSIFFIIWYICYYIILYNSIMLNRSLTIIYEMSRSETCLYMFCFCLTNMVLLWNYIEHVVTFSSYVHVILRQLFSFLLIVVL